MILAKNFGMNSNRSKSWKQKVKRLKQEIFALYHACRDPRVPWYARVLAVVVVGYAFSPIDLIPDPIPVLGYLDDLILIPAGIYLGLKLVPPDVMDDCRKKAAANSNKTKPKNWVAATIIVLVWLILFAGITYMVYTYVFKQM